MTLEEKIKKVFNDHFQLALYRPFTKCYAYRHLSFNDQVYQYGKIIPNNSTKIYQYVLME